MTFGIVAYESDTWVSVLFFKGAKVNKEIASAKQTEGFFCKR
jgi:hypothetical protein